MLDTCRVDALKEVAPEYDFIDNVNSIWSVGSATREWIANTFNRDRLDEIQETALVNYCGIADWVMSEGSPRITTTESGFEPYLCEWDVVNKEDFYLIEEVWQKTDGCKLTDLTRPETITNHAISVSREHNPNRMVVHYKQPHEPYTANALRENREMKPHEKDPFGSLRRGHPKEKIWRSYLDELRYGLDNVSVLLDNIDAEKVVITADHGEAFGEFGVYNHPLGFPHPKVKKVPWALTSAKDTRSHTPDIDQADTHKSSEEVEGQLEALGYM
ncbi:hypothetical protein [Halobaculum rarum]|uniref:hypothetical protein n=1 Tax=Halobaculum rarum TaxID=3075122 RepID=UPI0032AF69F0